MFRIKNLISRTRLSSRLFKRNNISIPLQLRKAPKFYFSSNKDNNNDNNDNKDKKNKEKEREKNKEEFQDWIYDQLNINAWSTLKKRLVGGSLLLSLVFYLFSNQINFLTTNSIDELDFWELLRLNSIEHFEVKITRSSEW